MVGLRALDPGVVFLLVVLPVALADWRLARSADEGTDDSRGVHAKEVNVVAAFLHDQNLIADFVELVRHVPIKQRAQLAPTQEIVYAAIKPARYYDDVGSEFTNHGKEQVVAGIAVLVIPKLAERVLVPMDLVDDLARLPGDVDVEVFSFAFADVFGEHLLVVRVEGEVVAAVHRDEQHLIVLVERALSAISVVDVPIENTNSLALVPCVLSSNCNVVENAKASRVAAFGMMTRRSHDTIASFEPVCVVVLLEHCLHALDRGENGQAGGEVALTAVINIVGLVRYGKLLFLDLRALRLHFLDVLRRVVQREDLLLQES